MKKNIALIFGGNNSEHGVSLSSASEVIKVIDKNLYHVIPVAVLKNGQWIMGADAQKYLQERDDTSFATREDIEEFVALARNGKIDLVLPIVHGAFGEDGRLQGFLDVIGMPYVFSGHLAHALGMDKAKTKAIVASQDVNVIDGCSVHKNGNYDVDDIVKKYGVPLVVKPNDAGSSIGISMVTCVEDLSKAIDVALHYSNIAIIEKKITARELTVGILERDGVIDTLPVIEIIPNTVDWYDYDAKYSVGGSAHICPADVPENIAERAQDYARKAFNTIGCKDLARVDILWDENSDQMYFLEINTIPGMTGTSLAPDAAREAGVSFDKLINGLIAQNL